MNYQDPDIVIHGKNPVILNSEKTFLLSNKRPNNSISKKLDSDEPPPPERTTIELTTSFINARIANGLTRKDIAKKLNMTENTYSKYENIGNVIIKKDLIKIKQYLKLTN